MEEMLNARGLKHAENYSHGEKMSCLTPPSELPCKAGTFLNMSSFVLVSDQDQGSRQHWRQEQENQVALG